jgi:hypothetical protein
MSRKQKQVLKHLHADLVSLGCESPYKCVAVFAREWRDGRQTHEMLFHAHNHAFRVFGGVPSRGIYNNMCTAIDKVSRCKEAEHDFYDRRETSHRENLRF